MKIILFGFMGCGKTTYGKAIAGHFDMEFIDLDDYIEHRENRTIKHIFETDGESKFREIEHIAMQEVLNNKDNIVMAAGGGTPCFYDNLKVMRQHGITIYLKVPVPVLALRLMDAKIYRPLIWGKTEKELTEYIKNTINYRKKFYNQAHIRINAEDLKVKRLERRIKAKTMVMKLMGVPVPF
jgi:shikimate kinase